MRDALEIMKQMGIILRNLGRRPDGRVIGAEKGGVLDPDKVYKALKTRVIARLCERYPTPVGEIGFKHTVVHSFRHFFVSEAFIEGATEGEVMAWVDHRDSRIVRRYRHIRPENAIKIFPRIRITGDPDEAKGGVRQVS